MTEIVEVFLTHPLLAFVTIIGILAVIKEIATGLTRSFIAWRFRIRMAVRNREYFGGGLILGFGDKLPPHEEQLWISMTNRERDRVLDGYYTIEEFQAVAKRFDRLMDQVRPRKTFVATDSPVDVADGIAHIIYHDFMARAQANAPEGTPPNLQAVGEHIRGIDEVKRRYRKSY